MLVWPRYCPGSRSTTVCLDVSADRSSHVMLPCKRTDEGQRHRTVTNTAPVRSRVAGEDEMTGGTAELMTVAVEEGIPDVS